MPLTAKPVKQEDLHRAKRGTAILAACIVQTLNESYRTFQERFLARLSEAYQTVKDDWEGDVIQELELIAWTWQYLTGFDWHNGQGEAFLSNYTPDKG